MPFPGFPGWILQIDPPAVASGGRTMLDINNPSTGIQVGGTSSGSGIDWGTVQITEMLAQEGQWGSTVADYIVPNRTITIPLGLGMGGPGTPDSDSAMAMLSQKVGLLQREGGWLLRQTATGEPLYADIVDAQLTPADTWGETGGIEPSVTLTLICIPDFYGDEISLDSIPCTGWCGSVLTLDGEPAVIAGDYPARARLQVTDQSGNNQEGLLWGVQSRYYDSASTAALQVKCSTLTGMSGAAAASVSGASGNGEAMGLELPTTDVPMLFGTLTNLGQYRVLCRASATAAVTLQLSWGANGAPVLTENTAEFVSVANEFQLVDLGVVNLPEPPVGSGHSWNLMVFASGATGTTVYLDELFLQPLSESAGSLCAGTATPVTSSVTSGYPQSWSAGSAANWTTFSYGPEESGWGFTTGAAATGPTADFTNFGLAIPSDATVTGITASITLSDSGGTPATSYQQAVALTGVTGSSTQSQGATWSGWPTVTYGSPTSLWGISSITPAQVNSSSFGLAITPTVTAITGSGSVYVGRITLTVYFAFATFTAAVDATVYANETCELRYDGAYRTSDGITYGAALGALGDLTRIPPSGLEDQAARVFVKPVRGKWADSPTVDAPSDAFTVTPIYRPCYLARI